ncbi:TetR/AcrR family transcriptional regulator [Nocardia barduliensis]|uniref:TetR/AcrR family transcriptional regulator n=1 Tax=Nocardia barduliensis TaxID=2736643 RepID=UPI0015741A46|nr:TetR/AcrR family transcriptional regulator [Nocardia barduliensis]
MARTAVATHAGRTARERILNSALAVFAERGYAGSSLHTIAKRAGLSRPGLLHHFPDKMSLLLAVLEQHDESTDTFVDDLTVPELLARVVATTERNLASREVIRLAHVCALATGEGAEVVARWSRRRMAQMRAEYVALGLRARERGEISADVDIDTIVALIIAAFIGLEHQWLLDESFDMVSAMRAFTAMVSADLGIASPS